MFITEIEMDLMAKQHPGLTDLFNQQIVVETPQGTSVIDSFATMPKKMNGVIVREVDAKFMFENGNYNYFTVFQSKEDQRYHVGFVMNGTFRLANTQYTKEEFERQFDQVTLKNEPSSKN